MNESEQSGALIPGADEYRAFSAASDEGVSIWLQRGSREVLAPFDLEAVFQRLFATPTRIAGTVGWVGDWICEAVEFPNPGALRI